MIFIALLAIIVPLVPGRLLVAALRLERIGYVERWAHAWLAGSAMLATAMVLWSRTGGSLSWFTVLAIAAALTILLVAIARFPRAAAPTTKSLSAMPPLPSRERVGVRVLQTGSDPYMQGVPPTYAWTIFAALILLRIAWVFADASIVPEHMTDAYENWLLRARIITGLGHVPTDPSHPYYLGGGRISYPLGTVMLAVWPALLNGGWDERIVNVAWPLYYVALLALAGAAVARRAGVTAGWITAYLLSSLPLLSIHAVRCGYADLPVAAHLLAASLLWCDAADSRRTGARGLAIIHSLFLVLLKREGLILFFLLSVPACSCMYKFLKFRARVGLLVLAIAALCLARFSDLSYVNKEAQNIHFHAEAVRAIIQRLFTWDTWSLLWWVPMPLLPVALWCCVRRGRPLIAIHCGLLIAFTAGVFLFTDNAAFAVNGWTLDRSVMQIAPLLLAATVIGLFARETPRDENKLVVHN